MISSLDLSAVHRGMGSLVGERNGEPGELKARWIRYKRRGRMSDKDVPSITSREKHLNRKSGAPVHAPTSSMLFQYALAWQARNMNAKVNVDDE